MVKNGGVQFFLSREVTENHRLRDPGGLGDFLGSRPPKPLVGKKSYGDSQNLQSPLIARHSHAAKRWRQAVKSVNLFSHSQIDVNEIEPGLQSKYLLTIGASGLSSRGVIHLYGSRTFVDPLLVPFHNKETTPSHQAFHLAEVDWIYSSRTLSARLLHDSFL